MKKTTLIAIVTVIAILLSIYLVSLYKPATRTTIKVNFCDGIYFQPLKKTCLMVFSKNLDGCNDVENGYDQLCYDILIEHIDVSQTTCDNINNNYGKFLCYKKLAVQTKDINFCKSNPECYKEVAIKSKDTKICDLLANPFEVQKCFALVFNDKSYCENIDEETEKRICITLVPQNADDCNAFNYYDAACLTKLASENKNSEICNLLTGNSEIYKWTCWVTVTDNPKACDDAGDFFSDICKITYLQNHLKNIG